MSTKNIETITADSITEILEDMNKLCMSIAKEQEKAKWLLEEHLYSIEKKNLSQEIYYSELLKKKSDLELLVMIFKSLEEMERSAV